MAAVVAFASIAHGQALVFPAPRSNPETVTENQDFPYIPALPGARLISTRRLAEPLELRQATADDEAVLAGMSYVQKTYDRPGSLTPVVFISALRDSLFAAGWKLIDVTKLEEIPIQPETVNVAAHYWANGRIIYARMTQEPGDPYQVNVADVGAEDWSAALARDCRLRPYSIQFDLDRSTFRPEATPTLEKLAVWLAAHGVSKAKLSSQGYGKTRPLAANDSDLGRAINRRIEIVRPGCSR